MQVARELFVVLALMGTDLDGQPPEEENLSDLVVVTHKSAGAIGLDEIFVCARPHALLLRGLNT